MKEYYNTLKDVIEFKRTEPNVKYRYFFAPSQPLTSGLDLLKFDPEVTKPMIEIGKQDAQTIIDLGEGVSFDRLESWHKSPSLRK